MLQQQQLKPLYLTWHKFFVERIRRGMAYPSFRGSVAPSPELVPSCSWEFLELCTVGELAFISVPVGFVVLGLLATFAAGALCGCFCCWYCSPRRRKAAPTTVQGKKDGHGRASGRASEVESRERDLPRLRRGRGTLA